MSEGVNGREAGGGHTALNADGGEAEVALVGEEAVPGVAPCCGENEVDHGEEGGGVEEAGEDISTRTLGDPTNIPIEAKESNSEPLLRFLII